MQEIFMAMEVDVRGSLIHGHGNFFHGILIESCSNRSFFFIFVWVDRLECVNLWIFSEFVSATGVFSIVKKVRSFISLKTAPVENYIAVISDIIGFERSLNFGEFCGNRFSTFTSGFNTHCTTSLTDTSVELWANTPQTRRIGHTMNKFY